VNLPSITPFVIAALVGVVAWGVGGYEPWAGLALELGALALFAWLFARTLFGTSAEERERFLAIRRSQKRGSAEVEILEPAAAKTVRGLFRDPYYWLGYPFRKNGAGLLLLLASAWLGLSLVPLPASWLALLSPSGFAYRSEAEALLGREVSFAPWSVAPFLTFQDLLLWVSFVLLFLVTHHVVSSSRAARRLSLALFLVGVASGLYGLLQWLVALSEGGAPGGALQATGSFGNRNHYALFQEMMVLIALGFLQLRWREAPRSVPNRVAAQEAKAKASLLAIGVAVIALSLLFSLSRSGITFSVAGGALLFYLTRGKGRALALAAGLLALGLWIGIDPVASRFQLAPDELLEDSGRTTVWRDSLGAVSDFWLTGSGSSSFQYIYPIYRSFGGRRFYSWAHNDYLQIWVELGLPGLLLTIALIVWAVRRARRVRRELLDAGSSLTGLHAGYCAAAFAVALHSFTDFGLHLPANAALFAVVLAFVTGMTSSRRTKEPKAPQKKTLRRAPPDV
jgi:O-antigen ligase